MKKIKTISLLTGLLMTIFMITAKAADITGTMYIKGTGITTSGTTATIAATPGSTITFTMGVNINSAIDTVSAPWTITNLTLTGTPEAKNGFTFTAKDSDDSILPKLTFVNANGVSNANGVDLAQFTFTVPSNFKSGDTAKIVFNNVKAEIEDTTCGNTYCDPKTFNVTGITLNVTYKAPQTNPTTISSDMYSVGTTTADSVTINYNKIGDNATCTLQRSTSATGTFTAVKNNIDCSKARSVTDTGLTADTTYYYKLVSGTASSAVFTAKTAASNSGGGSSGGGAQPVANVDGTDLGGGIIIPATEVENSAYANITPKSAGDPAVTNTTATIKFDPGVTEGKVYIYRSTNKDSGYTLITPDGIDASKKEFTDTGLTAGTTYYYRIRLVGGKNLSDVITVTTAAAEASKENKNGNVSANGTGAAAPIAVIALLGTGFIVLRKYNSKNKLFNRI